jgi:mono/diheme cytochrome c family protein
MKAWGILGLLAISAIGAVATEQAVAELDSKSYESTTPALSVEERRRAAVELQRQIEAERARAEAERAREAAAEAARQARDRGRSTGERLFETRCLSCHSIESLEGRHYGWLGWGTVVLRMRWINGAPIEAAEYGALIRHLARERSASTVWVALEWAALVGALAVLGWAGRRIGRARV